MAQDLSLSLACHPSVVAPLHRCPDLWRPVMCPSGMQQADHVPRRSAAGWGKPEGSPPQLLPEPLSPRQLLCLSPPLSSHCCDSMPRERATVPHKPMLPRQGALTCLIPKEHIGAEPSGRPFNARVRQESPNLSLLGCVTTPDLLPSRVYPSYIPALRQDKCGGVI